MTAKEMIVHGLVQGVYFRVNTKAVAQQLQLKGAVKNLPDGSVWIHAEGSAAAVDALQRWCHTGPPGAKVTQVVVKDTTAKGYEDFSILRG
jgi:acylphosphatase